jgi:hypothetical protein
LNNSTIWESAPPDLDLDFGREARKGVNIGGGPSRVIVPANIISINIPDLSQTIEMSGDFPLRHNWQSGSRSYVVVGDLDLLRKIGIRRL